MQRHEWITHELMSLSWYAHYLLEAISDESLSMPARSQAVAGAKYLVEWEDLIPDTDPLFGYVDDLFVVLIGLENLMKIGGREAIAKYGPKQLPGNVSLEQKLKEAKHEFAGFWEYVHKEVSGGFQDIQRAMRKDDSYIAQLKTMLQNYIAAASSRPVNPIDAPALENFLKHKHAKAGGASAMRAPNK
jgi:uncharacterized membrane protein YkvA (DUF1232 family)